MLTMHVQLKTLAYATYSPKLNTHIIANYDFFIK